jgi:hypothetical protein
MWSLFALLLLPACSTPAPTSPQAPVARGPGKAKTPGKARKSKTKAPPAPPLGVAGPVTGELKFTVVEEPPPAVPPPAEGTPTEGTPIEGAPPPAPAPAVTKTQADLLLTFSDGQTAPVTLGKVNGTCIDAPVTPIGPEGAQQTPLWNVQCTDAAVTSNLAILQAGDQITVLKASPAPDGSVAYKPVKRVRLASGATLSRKSG